MKSLSVSAAAIALGVLGFANGAQAQGAGAKLFFEGDIIRGAQQGAPGPFCVLNSQFKHLEKIVFRFRILDGNGKAVEKDGLKSLTVELPGGQKIEATYGQHPARGEPQDFFWTAAWVIPENQPEGTFAYKATAVSASGATQTWEPFKVKPSQFQVMAGAVEIKKPN
jgi:hypothetical protein